jgi:phosphatidylserine/phosphatidylglycerophosphate/cardiolipin synthase-like enzyme
VQTPFLQLVETSPIETTLDHADLPEAYVVWKEMIEEARRSLDFAEFYASDEPGSRLEPILAAMEEAAGRGVAIRFLAEKSFYKTYPEVLDRLRSHPEIAVRLYDVKPLMGGVLHAKYFLVDGEEAYLGSQNFDWRSLTHIQELGVRIRQTDVVGSLGDLFEFDWRLAAAGGQGGSTGPEESTVDSSHVFRRSGPASSPARLFPVVIADHGDTVRITPVMSPQGWIPDPALWDLPRLIDLIDSARRTLRVQLLTYGTVQRRNYFAPLETALRSAAARGVKVELLVSDWCERPGLIEGLQSLELVPGIEVRLVTIPPWSGGFIPYARVIHAKYMVADDDAAWIGTGNWEWDYFHASRNVGLVLDGRGPASVLNRFFSDGWNAPYAQPVHPCSTYVAPRIGE